MNKKQFRVNDLVKFNYSEIGKYVDENHTDTPLRNDEVCDLLNEQQDTIFKLQDLCGESDGENARLRIQNKNLKETNRQLREINKELGDDLYNCRLKKEDLENKRLKEENEQLKNVKQKW